MLINIRLCPKCGTEFRFGELSCGSCGCGTVELPYSVGQWEKMDEEERKKKAEAVVSSQPAQEDTASSNDSQEYTSCPRCMRKVLVSADVCPNCGQKISHPKPQQGMNSGIIRAVIGLIGVIYAMMTISSDKQVLWGYTYTPPFEAHEIFVLAVLVISAILLISGVSKVVSNIKTK